MSELYDNNITHRWVDSKVIKLGWITILNKQQAEAFGMKHGDFLPHNVAMLEGKIPLSFLRKISRLTSDQISALSLLCKLAKVSEYNGPEHVDLIPIVEFLNGS